ncbi:glutaredoxin family protein [Dietzia sp. 179-F 9C3 NHS]|uniref:glutaredoxin family protein n=1 Tax=Dietzia sp. 179-F 9C3 NHS TaxID=3374295 RepID=UPI00387A78FF
MRIIMATTTHCTLCPQVMKRLDKLGVDYEAIDIAVDTGMYDLVVNDLGLRQAPAFLLLDGDDPATATVLDHLGAYDKDRLLEWQTRTLSVAA